MMRYYLYRCSICGKEEVRSFTGPPPLILCPNCDDPGKRQGVAMELIKEVEG